MIELPLTKGGWRTLLIDPPWRYEATPNRDMQGVVENNYQSLEDQVILNLPIQQIRANDSQCWLWTTNSHLHLAFHCLERWGFEYKTTLTWVKNTVGIGFWLKGATEHLLFGVHGNVYREPFKHSGYSTKFLAPRGAHSAKPDAIYSLIEELSEAPRLEMFARRRREGWTAWGNQLESETQTVIKTA